MILKYLDKEGKCKDSTFIDSFDKESEITRFLLSCEPEISRNIMPLVKSFQEDRCLAYRLGVCDLQQYLDYRNRPFEMLEVTYFLR